MKGNIKSPIKGVMINFILIKVGFSIKNRLKRFLKKYWKGNLSISL